VRAHVHRVALTFAACSSPPAGLRTDPAVEDIAISKQVELQRLAHEVELAHRPLGLTREHLPGTLAGLNGEHLRLADKPSGAGTLLWSCGGLNVLVLPPRACARLQRRYGGIASHIRAVPSRDAPTTRRESGSKVRDQDLLLSAAARCYRAVVRFAARADLLRLRTTFEPLRLLQDTIKV